MILPPAIAERDGILIPGPGFGLSNYYQCTRPAQIKAQLDEEERLGRNRRLTEAYGGKDNLEDIERALEIYEVH